jgi:hypothetical protein
MLSLLVLVVAVPLAAWLGVAMVTDIRTRMRMNDFCAEKGRLHAVEPVKTQGIRFTPNRCSFHFSHALCRAASYPALSAPGLLQSGFHFVEYDLERDHSGASENFVRLRIEDRPSDKCEWIDASINRDPDIVQAVLSQKGIPPTRCLAAEFGGRSMSRYRFIMDTTEVPEAHRKSEHRAVLIDISKSRTIAELWTAQQGGSDKSSGIGCRNFGEFEKIMALVAPE